MNMTWSAAVYNMIVRVMVLQNHPYPSLYAIVFFRLPYTSTYTVELIPTYLSMYTVGVQYIDVATIFEKRKKLRDYQADT